MNISNNDKLLEDLNNINLDPNQYSSPIKTLPKMYTKRQRIVQQPQEKKLSYDDILNNMGMFVDKEEEEVYLLPKQQTNNNSNNVVSLEQNKTPISNKPIVINNNNNNNSNNEVINNNINRNSYIYNKYFKNELNTDVGEVRKPKTMEEYKLMLLQDLLQKQRIRQIKSRQIQIPTSNIAFSDRPNDLNRLFKYKN